MYNGQFQFNGWLIKYYDNLKTLLQKETMNSEYKGSVLGPKQARKLEKAPSGRGRAHFIHLYWIPVRTRLREWEGTDCLSNYSEKENVSSASFPRWGQALKKEEGEIREERGRGITLPDLCTHCSQDTGTAKKELWSQIYFKFLFSYFIFCFQFCSQEFISLFARTHLFPSLGLSCVKNGLLWQEASCGEITCDVGLTHTGHCPLPCDEGEQGN